jgi:hypothetical protein
MDLASRCFCEIPLTYPLHTATTAAAKKANLTVAVWVNCYDVEVNGHALPAVVLNLAAYLGTPNRRNNTK